MLHRLLCLSSATALLLALFACNTEAPPTGTGGSDVTKDPTDPPASKKPSTKKGGDPAPEGTGPATSKPPPSAPAKAECAQTKDQGTCFDCCDALMTPPDPATLATADKCMCDAAKAACSPVCAKIWCDPEGGEDTENCDQTCNPDTDKCTAPLKAACEKDEGCQAAKRCIDESKCDAKPAGVEGGGGS